MAALDEKTDPAATPGTRLCRLLARYGLALVLAGYVLFAHGCHGDDDNELFTAASVVMSDE
jgi:hypothetical protein